MKMKKEKEELKEKKMEFFKTPLRRIIEKTI